MRAPIMLSVLLFAGVAFSCPAHATTTHIRKSVKKSSVVNHSAKKSAPVDGSTDPVERQLTQLSRALKEDLGDGAYTELSAFATRNAKNEFGERAALALGYYDYSRGKSDAAMAWLKKADDDTVLREYAQYWQIQVLAGTGQKAETLDQLEAFQHGYPQSVMIEQALLPLVNIALDLGKPADALDALDSYPGTVSKPSLLLLRAQAREKLAQMRGEMPLSAAEDYLQVYYHFPLSDEARTASTRLLSLQSALGENYPGTPLQSQIARAETFFLARRWRDARSEFTLLLPKMSGADHERAELRVAECDIELGGQAELLTSLDVTDPEVDAERIYAISQAHRSQKLEAQMLDGIEDLAMRFPRSPWLEEGLFDAGNFYWVNLDRDRASEFYRRAVDSFPDGKNAQTASWRIAWTAYIERKPEAADMIDAYVRSFPSGSYVPDALYWLGRSYERAGYMERARSFYMAAVNRFPLTYFGERAAERLRPQPEGIGSTPATAEVLLSVIPPAAPLTPIDLPVTQQAQQREVRARALTSIAFDSSAELEYRAAYAVSHSPRLLLEAAAAAGNAGRYGAGIVATRQVFPQLDARQIGDVPLDAWRNAFPLPYEASLRTFASHDRVDPMLVAGVIRQESAFDSKALSAKGAVGLMQVMPKTASKLAHQIGVHYVRRRLTEPSYNIQLGSHYLAGLIKAYGTPEAALAAYNAGEDRVEQWTAGQNYLEVPEFVESIPFTETREYVQVVMRNAEVYRQVYGATSVVDLIPAPARSVVLEPVSAPAPAAVPASLDGSGAPAAEATR